MNWYKKSKQETKPYNIYIIMHGVEQSPSSLKNKFEDAYSSEQARMFFLNKYSFLLDYLKLGYEVEARVNEQEVERRKNINKFEEDKVDSAWWNK
jgi:hypothetical protein